MTGQQPPHPDAWEAYRTALVDKTLNAFYLLGWIGLPLFIWRSLVGGWSAGSTLTVVLVVTGMLFQRFYKGASTELKGLILVGVFFGLGVPGLLNLGVMSNGLLLVASGCMCASLLFSRRASLWLCAVVMIFLALVGLGFVNGALQLKMDANAFATSPATWVTAVFVNFLSVLLLITQISSFRQSLQTLLLEVQQQRDVIAHQANHDQLTGLPTQRLANDRLQMALNAARRHGEKVAVLFIDLDGFKQANDSFGHDAGDHVLQQVAERIRQSIRDTDSACRIGGDEFLVILAEVANRCAAVETAEKIIARINQPVAFNDQSITIGCSIGIGLYPEDAGDSDSLRRAADAAMYAVKRSGKNGIGGAAAAVPRRVALPAGDA